VNSSKKRCTLQMNHHSAPAPVGAPNDRSSVDAGALFYVSDSSLLSYFGNFGKIPKKFVTCLEAASPLHQGVIRGDFRSPPPCMAIV
jgi:hypothetical protein